MTIRLRTLGKLIVTIEAAANMKPEQVVQYVQYMTGRFYNYKYCVKVNSIN